METKASFIFEIFSAVLLAGYASAAAARGYYDEIYSYVTPPEAGASESGLTAASEIPLFVGELAKAAFQDAARDEQNTVLRDYAVEKFSTGNRRALHEIETAYRALLEELDKDKNEKTEPRPEHAGALENLLARLNALVAATPEGEIEERSDLNHLLYHMQFNTIIVKYQLVMHEFGGKPVSDEALDALGGLKEEAQGYIKTMQDDDAVAGDKEQSPILDKLIGIEEEIEGLLMKIGLNRARSELRADFTARAGAESKAGTVLGEVEAIEEQIEQWGFPSGRARLLAEALHDLKHARSKPKQEMILLEAAARLAKERGIKGLYGALFPSGRKGVPLRVEEPDGKVLTDQFGYADIDKKEIVVSRDVLARSLNGFVQPRFRQRVDVREPDVRWLENRLEDLAVHFAHELAHIEKPYPGNPLKSELYAWRATVQAMRIINETRYADKIDLIERLIDLVESKNQMGMQALGRLAEDILLGRKGLAHLQDLVSQMNSKLVAVNEAVAHFGAMPGVDVIEDVAMIDAKKAAYEKVVNRDHIVFLISRSVHGAMVWAAGVWNEGYGVIVYDPDDPRRLFDPNPIRQLGDVIRWMGRKEFESLVIKWAAKKSVLFDSYGFTAESLLIEGLIAGLINNLQGRVLKVSA
jgi:hypothetical protein